MHVKETFFVELWMKAENYAEHGAKQKQLFVEFD
jgi:hypothetical protein